MGRLRHAGFFITLEEERDVCQLARLENVSTEALLYEFFRKGLKARIEQLSKEERDGYESTSP